VDLRESAEQLDLRHELRAYFAALLPEQARRAAHEQGVGGPAFREIVAKLGADGWLGIGWPTEFGGQGRSVAEQYVFFDEVQRAGIPFPFVTVNTVGPTLMAYGTEEQKRRYLPGILSGELVFAIGYTEPGAGTDLASLTTRAVLDGSGETWVVDGSKVFTSGANTADYIWLACRTDADAPVHKGISILIASTADPGFSWTPIPTVGGMSVTATYYSGVRVPAGDLVGPVHGGWSLITAQLNHERIGLAALGGRAIALWEQTVQACRDDGALDAPWVRAELARTHARLEAMRLLNWRMTEAVAAGTLGPADASATKVYGTETHLDTYRTLVQVLGAAGRLRAGRPPPATPSLAGGPPLAALAGELEQVSRQSVVNTFGGGVNEVLRDIVATAGLGLPRVKRTT
jgi:3-oxocholest-4-en-26-oyl-CoA dehydrogenase alpha subunit